MICSAIVFTSFAPHLVRIFTSDASLVKIAVPIMYILSIFQVFDGLQISLAGVCKGIKQTNVVLFANFIAYWCVSIPLGCFLAFHVGFMLKGFWWGLVSAACLLCMIMLVKLKNILSQFINKLKTRTLKIVLVPCLWGICNYILPIKIYNTKIIE